MATNSIYKVLKLPFIGFRDAYKQCEYLIRKKRLKIFCVGLSRTGTTSLTKALSILGYKAEHFDAYLFRYSEGKLNPKLQYAAKSDALSDTPVARFYQEMDAGYPHAKFILTVREMDKWLESCRKHFWPGRFDHRPDLNQLHRDLYDATEFDREKFEKGYNKHQEEVLTYFKNRKDDLLILDICGGEGWERLCPFLKKPIPEKAFPKLNATDNR